MTAMSIENKVDSDISKLNQNATGAAERSRGTHSQHHLSSMQLDAADPGSSEQMVPELSNNTSSVAATPQ